MNDPLERTIRVGCSIGHAFDVFTGEIDTWWPPGHRRFEASRLHLETAPGGRFYERTTAGEEAVLGEVLECDPPHRIRYTWYPGSIDKPTLVDVGFTEDGDATIVVVTHSEGDSELGPNWSDRVVLFDRGWDHVLAAFSTHVERREA